MKLVNLFTIVANAIVAACQFFVTVPQAIAKLREYISKKRSGKCLTDNGNPETPHEPTTESTNEEPS